MLAFLSAALISRATTMLPVLCALLLLPGCATPLPAKAREPMVPLAAPTAHIDSRAAAGIPVLRTGRYALIEVAPEAPQRDLMQQIVDLSFPPPFNSTVGAALRYLLLRTGYQLCDASPVKDTLDAWPLPAAHLHLGPLTLRQAVEVLAGPAWTLQVDESTRQVCFVAPPNVTTPIAPIFQSRPVSTGGAS